MIFSMSSFFHFSRRSLPSSTHLLESLTLRESIKLTTTFPTLYSQRKSQNIRNITTFIWFPHETGDYFLFIYDMEGKAYFTSCFLLYPIQDLRITHTVPFVVLSLTNFSLGWYSDKVIYSKQKWKLKKILEHWQPGNWNIDSCPQEIWGIVKTTKKA